MAPCRTLAVVVSLALMTPVFAAQQVVEVRGAVAEAGAALPPAFDQLAPGDSARLRLALTGVADPLTPSAFEYDIDASQSQLTIGAQSSPLGTSFTHPGLVVADDVYGEDLISAYVFTPTADPVVLRLDDPTAQALGNAVVQQAFGHGIGPFDLPTASIELLDSATGARAALISVERISFVDPNAASTYCGGAVPNSTGLPARIGWTGSNWLSLDTMAITCEDLPPGRHALLLVSQRTASVTAPGGSSGVLCIGGQIGLYADRVQRANSNGYVHVPVTATALPGPTGVRTAAPGTTWYFQYWYRDVTSSGPGTNFSDGLEVTYW